MLRISCLVGLSALVLSGCAAIEEDSAAGDQALYNAFLAARGDSDTVFAAYLAANGIDLEALLELEEDGELTTAEIAALLPTLSTAPASSTAQMAGAYKITASGLNSTIAGRITMDVDFADGTTSGVLHNSFLDADGTADSSVVELDGNVGFNGNVDLTDGFHDANNVNWQVQAAGEGTLVDATDTAETSTDYRLDFDLHGDLLDVSAMGEIGGVGDVGDVASYGEIDGNIDVTSADDTTLYDVSSGEYFVFEQAD